ncbi:uncharacterized protein LOC119112604 [Pollicipes pollicipes]|uniref:uncharacterized protein LOC119112604 n=1 Tax=Pollicipes pollicipes TaxID=41117 RepID=UPI001884D9EA|nr:uncharacterized protein LOC119112604 [Pollicipes pollicipes]
MTTFLCTLVAALGALAGVSDGQSSGSDNTSSGTSVVSQMPGGTVSMQCNFHPGGTVLWYKQESDGKMEFARDAQLIVSDNRYQIRSENGAYVLTINPTREEDSGQFMCHSSDMRGMIYEHTFLVSMS